MKKILMVEDEFMVAKRLKRFIENAFNEQKIELHICNNLYDAHDYLVDHIIDVLFLDLNLQGQNGFDLLKHKLCESFHTIIVSANSDKAIEAFDIGVLDFVAKPFTQERIQKAVNRLQHKSQGTCKYLTYKQLGKIELLPIENILYIKADGHYSVVMTQVNKRRLGNSILHEKNLDKLLTLLPEDFVRIHRSFAVSLANVRSIVSTEGSQYYAQLYSGEQIPVGRTRVKHLKAKIAG
ncbi:LytTR family DNA-binding domain-containing protein [Thalassotalea sp. 1_MG-2023]|uniref:LytR/AlgR family response regulator transcription factor n=1 Tax=Thalassotalea sp. 1_MG-2023 TaxID=3062680 RepID=UPI0026E1F720|nr:LytTR family DNA-binding domain-containing protein [Thalassotalea sp. 1_MG-2023]MDO6427683.1 LytTR family DNA-binding domain-containing protein [Thalassotalea sp. 1_MG-2023]